ncbi:hypothetical protein COBT_003079, partial [Conglomerata obtusa]
MSQNYTDPAPTSNTARSKLDMASAVNATREFFGKDTEDVNTWLQSVKMIAAAADLSTEDTTRLIIIKLRDSAQLWAGELLNKHPSLTFFEFTKHLLHRFGAKVNNMEILNRFLKTEEAKSKNKFVTLLKDASIIFERGFMNLEPLMQLIISRAPNSLRTLLYQISYENLDWNDIIRQFTECSWIPFKNEFTDVAYHNIQNNTTNSINNSSTTRNNIYKNSKKNLINFQKNQNRKFLCVVHGWCGHNTERCIIYKKMIQNGYTIKKNQRINQVVNRAEMYDFEDDHSPNNNKGEVIYSCVSDFLH